VRIEGNENVSKRWPALVGLTLAAAALVAVASAGSASTAVAVEHRTVASEQDATIRADDDRRQLVIGNALRGVPVDRGAAVANGFHKVYVYGAVQHCAWLPPNVTTTARPGPVRHTCASFSEFQVRDYARRVNCLPNGHSEAYLDKNYPGSSQCRDGSKAKVDTTRAGCGSVPVYANIGPWQKNASPADRYGTITTPMDVQWRYIAKDTGWVMVHGPTLHAGQSHWYFVPRACVTAPDVHKPNALPYRPLQP
jgi:hypothetical protein